MSLNPQGANVSIATATHLAYKTYQYANESQPPRSQCKYSHSYALWPTSLYQYVNESQPPRSQYKYNHSYSLKHTSLTNVPMSVSPQGAKARVVCIIVDINDFKNASVNVP